MRIAEIFHSIQGEGQFAGTPSVFVRTTGCNLRCWFCDTRYTSWEPSGEQVPWEQVAEQALAFGCEHVVITGGEPLLLREIVPLTEWLAAEGRFITIETAGTVFRPVRAGLLSISPKLSNSTPRNGSRSRWGNRHENLRENLDVVRQFVAAYEFQLKFVVDHPADLDEIEAYLARVGDVSPDRVWLMPQATTAAALDEKSIWLEPAAMRRGYHFTTRLHIALFGNVRGK